MSCKICKMPVLQAVGPALGMILVVALPVMLVTTFWPDLSLAIHPAVAGHPLTPP